MKKLLMLLTMLCMVFSVTACDKLGLFFDKLSNNNSQSNGETGTEIVLSEIADSFTAELGERFDIPEVTAIKDGKPVEVAVTVKTTAGEDVELQGRGTRFTASSIEGYIITYSAGEGDEAVAKTVTVSVSDSMGPKIEFEEVVDGIVVRLAETVVVPKPIWSDVSGEVLDATYSVTYLGKAVTVVKGENGAPDTFVADRYGDYIITYSALDTLGNKTETEIVISCARSVVIEDFEAMDTVWADPSFGSISEENAVEGNSLMINCTGEWQLVAIYPYYYDLSGFDKFQITIYSTADIDVSDEGFYILNQRYPLSEGKNVITITKEEFWAQYPDGKVPSTARPEYYDAHYVWCQVKGSAGTIWLDSFIGIFDNYTEDTVAPVIDFGKEVFFDKITVNEGRKFVLPNAVAYDNSMENAEVSVVVTNKAGEDITDLVVAGNYIVKGDEEYTVTYTATDASGNKATKTVEVEVLPKVTVPDVSEEEYFPAEKAYDVLQDFEGTGMSWTQIENSYETEHVLSGEKSLRLSTTNADTCVVLTLLKNGVRLETADWEKYEYIQAYVYADTEGARFDFYANMHKLEVGPNIITITSAEIIAEIAKASNVYDANGGFYFQLTTGTVYVDSIIGVYPEGYIPEEPGESEEPEVPEAITNYFPTDRTYDTLQSFDEGGVDTWFFPNSEGVTATKAVKGNAFRVQGEANWHKLPIMMLKNGEALTEADWKAYESFKLAIYSEGDATFAFLNKIYTLVKGWNVIEISAEEMWTQISSNAECYVNGYFWCQLANATVDLYFDELIGVYPEDYTTEEPGEPEEPEVPEAIANYFPTDRTYDTLQSFDEGGVDTWFFPNSEGVTATKAVKGNAFRVQGEANWHKLPIMMLKNGEALTEADWKAYESFKLAIYSEGDATFAFLNKIYTLVKGWNVIEISAEEMWTQISSNAECYVNGYFWCQLANATVDLYFDELIGIYPATEA